MAEEGYRQGRTFDGGKASGWSAQTDDNGWSWQAHGPFGDDAGTAPSEEAAVEAARAAEQRLRTR